LISLCRELPHGVFFAVNKKRTFRAGLFLPRQQLGFVDMGGKPASAMGGNDPTRSQACRLILGMQERMAGGKG
jgi:hypothetical protein